MLQYLLKQACLTMPRHHSVTTQTNSETKATLYLLTYACHTSLDNRCSYTIWKGTNVDYRLHIKKIAKIIISYIHVHVLTLLGVDLGDCPWTLSQQKPQTVSVEIFSEYQEMTSLPDCHLPSPWSGERESYPHPSQAAACADSARWRRRGDCHRLKAAAHMTYIEIDQYVEGERE